MESIAVKTNIHPVVRSQIKTSFTHVLTLIQVFFSQQSRYRNRNYV